MNKILIFIFLFLNLSLLALDPIKVENSSGESIFATPKEVKSTLSKEDELKHRLSILYALYYRSSQLDFSCRSSHKQQIVYSSIWKEKKALRMIFANLQSVLLDISVKGLGAISNKLMSRSEYLDFSNNIVSSYCSKNITVLSHEQIKQNLYYYFDTPVKLATLKDSHYFSKQVREIEKKYHSNENLQNIYAHIFKAACSWQGDDENPGLLSLFLENPVIYTLLSTDMSGKSVGLNSFDNSVVVLDDQRKDFSPVSCNGIICRHTTSQQFKEVFPRALGSLSIEKDFENLYCKYRPKFRKMVNTGTNDTLRNWMKKYTTDSVMLMVGEVIAWRSKTPFFFSRLKNTKQIGELLISPLIDYWNNWAEKELNKTDDFSYEEQLFVEKLPLEKYFNSLVPKFKVALELNLGELDRSYYDVGKLKIVYNLKFEKEMIAYVRRQWYMFASNDKRQASKIKAYFKLQIRRQIKEQNNFMLNVPYKGDLEEIIVNDLLEQFSQYRGNFFDEISVNHYTIPVELNYGLFALKYLNYKYKHQLK